MATLEDAAERVADIARRMEAGVLSLDEGAALIAAAQAFAEARKSSTLEIEVRELRDTVSRLAAMIEQGQGR
jgi:hypothetical protein